MSGFSETKVLQDICGPGAPAPRDEEIPGSVPLPRTAKKEGCLFFEPESGFHPVSTYTL